MSLLQVEMWCFILIQESFTLLSIAAGTPFLLKPLRDRREKRCSPQIEAEDTGLFSLTRMVDRSNAFFLKFRQLISKAFCQSCNLIFLLSNTDITRDK